MKRMGRVASMDGIMRARCSMEELALEEEREASGGMYVPLSRKDLMLDMRRSEEAEGETRMIGSGRRPGLGLRGSAVVRAVRDSGAPGLRPMKDWAILRTWEKSWGVVSLLFLG